MQKAGKIDYIEMPARDFKATKRFFNDVFGWTFKEYGEGYCAVENAGVDAGFYKAAQMSNVDNGSPLVVLYGEDLESLILKVEEAGGNIKRPVFAFPGGHRFHFTDPSGNEFAVWSDKEKDR